MDAPKRIKFEFATDRQGARAHRQEVREITKEYENLNRVTRGGSSGGSGGGATFGGGGGSGKAGASVNPYGSSLARTISENKDVLKGLSRQSRESLGEMRNALRDSVDKQVRDLTRLKSAIKEVADTMSSARNTFGPMAGPALNYHGQRMSGMLGAESQVSGNLARTQGALGAVESQMSGGGSAGWLEIGKNIGKSVALVVGPILKVAAAGYSSAQTESLKSPWDLMGQFERQSGSYQRAAQATKGGDLKLMAAFENLRRDPNFLRDFQRIPTGHENSISSSFHFQRGPGGGVESGGGFRRIRAALDSFHLGNPVKQWNEGVRNINNISVDQRTEMLEYAQRHIQAFPLFYEAYDQLQQGYRGDISSRRALGIGSGRIDPRTGARPDPGLRVFRSFANRGFDRGEVIGAQQSLESGGAGEYGGHRLLGAAVSGGAAHIYSSAQLLASVAQQSGTDKAQAVLYNLRSMVGRGALDPAAATRLGGMVAAGVADGGAPTSGNGFLGAMGVFGRGLNPTDSMRVTAGLPGGANAVGNLAGGRIDPYQSGRNLLSAIKAAPNASIFAQEYLATSVGPRLMADILGNREGEVPLELKARGLGQKEVKGYWHEVSRSIFDRNIRAQGNQTPNAQQELAQRVIASGGDWKDWFLKERKKRSDNGQDVKNWGENAFRIFGTMLYDERLTDSEAGGEGMARILAGMGSNAAVGREKGRGGGDAGFTGTQAKLNREVSGFEGDIEKEREAMATGIEAKIASMRGWVGTLTETGLQIGPAVEKVSKNLLSLADTLEKVMKRLAPLIPPQGYLPIQAAPKR